MYISKGDSCGVETINEEILLRGRGGVGSWNYRCMKKVQAIIKYKKIHVAYLMKIIGRNYIKLIRQ